MAPSSEWDRQTDRQTDGGIAALLYAPYCKAVHYNAALLAAVAAAVLLLLLSLELDYTLFRYSTDYFV